MADDPGTGRVPLRQFTPPRGEGLHGKYAVWNNETGVQVSTCFVLRYDRDPHARAALLAYAESCMDENPRLALDLRAAVSRKGQ